MGGCMSMYVCMEGGYSGKGRGGGGSKVEAVVGEIWMVGCKGSGWV